MALASGNEWQPDIVPFKPRNRDRSPWLNRVVPTVGDEFEAKTSPSVVTRRSDCRFLEAGAVRAAVAPNHLTRSRTLSLVDRSGAVNAPGRASRMRPSSIRRPDGGEGDAEADGEAGVIDLKEALSIAASGTRAIIGPAAAADHSGQWLGSLIRFFP